MILANTEQKLKKNIFTNQILKHIKFEHYLLVYIFQEMVYSENFLEKKGKIRPAALVTRGTGGKEIPAGGRVRSLRQRKQTRPAAK